MSMLVSIVILISGCYQKWPESVQVADGIPHKWSATLFKRVYAPRTDSLSSPG